MSDIAVFSGIEFTESRVNTDDATIINNVRAAIRRGHPQVWPVAAPNTERVCLVAGGPSLADTEQELRDLYFAGAKVVTVNGAYHWCLERNIRPSAQVVMDARAFNARFVEPAVPRCRYYLASQCDPRLWDAVEGREFVGIFHDAGSDAVKALLDDYYLQQWQPVPGGTTVGTRALALLRMLGYLRFDLFGFDSCWLDGAHHAYAQRENDTDRRLRVTISPTSDPTTARTFECAPWHLKQAEDFITMIRLNGGHFLLNVHGRGLLAFLLASAAEADITIE